MTRLRTKLLKEGMSLAADVRNMDGMVLLPAGAALTQRHIEILLAWGVSEASVESTEEAQELADPLARLAPDDRARLTEETRSLFWNLDDTSPVECEVFTQVLRRKARQLPPA